MFFVFGRHRVKRNRDAGDESSRGSQPGLNLNRDGPSAETAIWETHAQLLAALESVITGFGYVQGLAVFVVDPNRLVERRALERDFGDIQVAIDRRHKFNLAWLIDFGCSSISIPARYQQQLPRSPAAV